MCGIFGIVDYTKSIDIDFVKRCTDAMYRRGPDNGGYHVDNEDNFSIGFGHRRLSIVDLSDNGNQPFEYDNLTLVFNGEIYNHKILKEELLKFNYQFTSSSDTEVAIKYIHCFGLEKAIEKFNGMFAIGLFDKLTKKLTLVRDRLGVKPLYYTIFDEKIIFSSEIKSILSSGLSFKIEKNSIALYLKYGYVPTPFTMWHGIKKLEIGSYIEFDLSTKGNYKVVKYWRYKDKFNINQASLEENLFRLDEILNESIKLRLDADVEVGCFLSGGYDSSLTAAIMQKQSERPIKTFTIGFAESEFDESSYARDVANYLGTNHHHYECTPDFVKKAVKTLPLIWDDPISDTSVFPTLLVSEFSRKYVKVAMSSDGGDEIFAGYNIYTKSIRLHNIIRFIPCKNAIGSTLRLLTSKDKQFFSKGNRRLRRISRIIESRSPVDIKRSYQNIFDDQEIFRLCNFDMFNQVTESSSIDQLNDMLIDDIEQSHVDQLLTKVDRASMHSSLEAREPLLDLNLLEFASKLKEENKIYKGQGKYLLKKLAHKYIKKQLLDRPKQGFSIPIKRWLENELSEFIDLYFSNRCLEHGFFNNSCVFQIVERFKNGEELNFKQVWTLLSFQIWYEEWSKYDSSNRGRLVES